MQIEIGNSYILYNRDHQCVGRGKILQVYDDGDRLYYVVFDGKSEYYVHLPYVAYATLLNEIE